MIYTPQIASAIRFSVHVLSENRNGVNQVNGVNRSEILKECRICRIYKETKGPLFDTIEESKEPLRCLTEVVTRLRRPAKYITR